MRRVPRDVGQRRHGGRGAQQQPVDPGFLANRANDFRTQALDEATLLAGVTITENGAPYTTFTLTYVAADKLFPRRSESRKPTPTDVLTERNISTPAVLKANWLTPSPRELALLVRAGR